MSAPGPSLFAHDFWGEHETRCLSIIERALVLLRQKEDLPSSEDELNYCFYFCLLEATRELFPESDVCPVSECNNQPDPDSVRAARLAKRPDFQWVCIDRYEIDPHQSSKQFVVECKRLGTVSSAAWIFNINYVNNGIERFRDPTWGYAKRFRSGAMVGYWQSMEAHEVLAEVHDESQKKPLPDLMLIDTWKPNDVSRLEHTFVRSFELSPFRLHHLWVDLRSTAHLG
jgi:hypothetical protein